MINKLLTYKRPPISIPFILIGLLTLAVVVWLRSGDLSDTVYLIFLICNYLSWSILLPFIYGFIIQFNRGLSQIAVFSIKTLLLIIVHFIISNVFYYILLGLFASGYQEPSLALLKEILGPSLLLRALDFILILGILSWSHQSKELTSKKMSLLEAESELDKAKLKSLQSQLNPHFLFNTLHMISNLIGRSDEKAREITIKISALLRKVLITNEKESHSLKDELEIVSHYLAIEQERFNDRLTIEKKIDSELLNYSVPTFLLQPLIENAFKHGISQVEGPVNLQINISKCQNENSLCIEITNDIPKQMRQSSDSTGIGLKNIRARLKTLYKDKFSFETINTSNDKYLVTIKIPFEI